MERGGAGNEDVKRFLSLLGASWSPYAPRVPQNRNIGVMLVALMATIDGGIGDAVMTLIFVVAGDLDDDDSRHDDRYAEADADVEDDDDDDDADDDDDDGGDG